MMSLVSCAACILCDASHAKQMCMTDVLETGDHLKMTINCLALSSVFAGFSFMLRIRVEGALYLVTCSLLVH